MTKGKIIREVLQHVCNELDAKLSENEYSEFLGGSIAFRLDLVRKPSRTFVTVDLPPKSKTPKPLKIEFKRPYTRLVDRVDAPVVTGRRKGAQNAK